MSQAGFTPIQLYFSTTAAAVPTSGNLANGELAINITDEKLYFKNAAGTVKLLASNATSAPVLSFSAGTTGFTPSTATTGAVTLAGTLGTANGGTGLTSFTSGGVVYASSSSALATGSGLVFDGINLGVGNSPVNSGSTTTLTIYNAGASALYLQNSTSGTTSSDGATLQLVASDLTITNRENGYIRFNTNNTEALRIDSSQNVAIGASSAGSKLDVVRSATTTTAFDESVIRAINTGAATLNQRVDIAMRWQDGTYNGIGGISMLRESATARSGSLVFLPIDSGGNGLAAMRLDSAGNLGLGVTPSAWRSTYKASQVGNATAVVGRTDNNNNYFSSNWYVNSSNQDIYINTGFATLYSQGAGTHAFYTAASGTAGNTVSFTQAMTLTAGGELLVGTTSASALSSASRGLIELNGSSDSVYSYKSGGNLVGYTLGSAIEIRVASFTAIPLTFYTNATERARIDSSGDLLVGTTTNNPGIGNTANGVKAGASLIAASRASNFPAYFNRNTDDGGVVWFGREGNQVGSISVTTLLTAYNTTSDYRLKTVVGAVTGQGARIDALEPIEYTWNSNGSRTRGFLAHKFQEVYADSVTGEKDAVDADGNPVYQAMQASTSEVIADLVAEIQSLRQRLSAANL